MSGRTFSGATSRPFTMALGTDLPRSQPDRDAVSPPGLAMSAFLLAFLMVLVWWVRQ